MATATSGHDDVETSVADLRGEARSHDFGIMELCG